MTNFQCGGYSIGISCSLLLADPPFIISFLKRWATIQINLVSGTNPTVKKPIFYLHSVRTTDTTSPTPLSPRPCKKPARTVVFKADRRTASSDTKSLALLCAEDAEKATGLELGSNFSLLVRQGSGEVRVESAAKGTGLARPRPGLEGRPSRVSWECFGAEEVAFQKGNFPALVSHWIGSPDGFVMVSPYEDRGEYCAYVFVTI